MVGGIDKDNIMKKIFLSLIAMPLIVNAEPSHFDKNLKGFHVEVTESKTLKAEDEYISTKEQDRYINYFLNLPKNSHNEKKYFSSTKNKADTHLKSNLSEIKLSVPYTEPVILKDKIFSYAPIGSYNEGWTGIRTFFQDQLLGTCSYSFERYVYIKADSSYLKHIVNNKPSFSSIEGNDSAGFLYTLSWDVDNKDSVYDHKIECANVKLNKGIMENMIKLAKMIDKS
jgi:hypothetical protein